MFIRGGIKINLREANLKKREYLAFFDKADMKYALGNLSKPYIGSLSPGCVTCVNGTWSCLFINESCTKNCFFCPQDRIKNPKYIPRTQDGVEVSSAQEYVKHLKEFHFEGIGFSGGEPLLVFDKLIEYLKGIRNALGSKHYIWCYTNGDLLTKEKLEALNKAGLNEIRLDIAANNYDLAAAALAYKYIDTVSIEIPAIPEDLEIVKNNLKKFEDIGIKYLNLHQLFRNTHNKEQFDKRNYTPTHLDLYSHNDPPIIESELTAFEILKYAINKGSNLRINYCSRCCKLRFQGQANRKRRASMDKNGDKSISETGFIRKFAIKGSEINIKQLSKILKEDDPREIDISYYEPHDESKTIFEFGLENVTSILFFHKLFIESKNTEQTAKEMQTLYGLSEKELRGVLEDVKEFHKRFECLEFNPTDIPDYT